MQEEIKNNTENTKSWKRHFTVKNIIINGLIALVPASLIIGILRELGVGGAIVICGVIFGLMYLTGEIREKIIFKIRLRRRRQVGKKLASEFAENLNRNVLKEHEQCKKSEQSI